MRIGRATASSSSPRSARRRRTRSTRASRPARDRRRQHDPRVRDDQPRHGAGRRRHAHRQRQLDHGLRARRARLPGRQQDDLRQLHASSPATSRRRLGDLRRHHAVHQFVRIGAHAFTGMGSFMSQDVPPYVMAAGHMASPYGINSEGLKRRGFSPQTIAGAQARLPDAVPQRADARGGQAASSRPRRRAARKCKPILDFLSISKRGIIR